MGALPEGWKFVRDECWNGIELHKCPADLYLLLFHPTAYTLGYYASGLAYLNGMHYLCDLYYANVCDCIKTWEIPFKRGYYTGIVGDHSEPDGLRYSLAKGECGLKLFPSSHWVVTPLFSG